MTAMTGTFRIESRESGQILARVRIGSEFTDIEVQWAGEGAWEHDEDGLAMVLFPDEIDALSIKE